MKEVSPLEYNNILLLYAYMYNDTDNPSEMIQSKVYFNYKN